MDVMIYILTAVSAYFIGSISPAIIISSKVIHKDVRDYGSGNAGATNMTRTFGAGFGVLTFILDILKGALVAAVCKFVLAPVINDHQGLVTMIGSIAVILGHTFPVYYKFRGGKGVSSALGVFLIIMTVPTLVCLAVSFTIIGITRMVSVGSIVGMFLCSGCSLIFQKSIYVAITVIVLTLFSLYLHRENIVRIFKGTERKLTFKKKT